MRQRKIINSFSLWLNADRTEKHERAMRQRKTANGFSLWLNAK